MNENIIRDNLVINQTFPLRLYNFLEDTEVYDGITQEEKEYLLSEAIKMVDNGFHGKVTIVDHMSDEYVKINRNSINNILV